jgi:hypothetical protein
MLFRFRWNLVVRELIVTQCFLGFRHDLASLEEGFLNCCRHILHQKMLFDPIENMMRENMQLLRSAFWLSRTDFTFVTVEGLLNLSHQDITKNMAFSLRKNLDSKCWFSISDPFQSMGPISSLRRANRIPVNHRRICSRGCSWTYKGVEFYWYIIKHLLLEASTI